jgi:formylglycine-generating enzyme required for sulfatase activity
MAASREVPFVNTFGMLFVPIPRYKTLFSIIPVRICDYEVYCAKNKLTLPPCDFAQGPDHPVVNVTWHDAVRFCEWMTQREHERGVIDRDLFYRLPTDSEWSAAVGLPNEPQGTPKARSNRFPGFPWGHSFPPPPGAGNYHALLKIDPFAETSPVASFPPNPFGLYDLGGNVWEWCMDQYEPASENKVARGASCFNDGEDYLQSSHRESIAPKKCRNNVGFRVSLSEGFSKDPRHRLNHNPWG